VRAVRYVMLSFNWRLNRGWLSKRSEKKWCIEGSKEDGAIGSLGMGIEVEDDTNGFIEC
jgi:hypothetical protein